MDKPEVKMNSFDNLLRQFRNGANQMSNINRPSVVIMGNTDSGKTALSAYLSGINFVIQEDKYGDLFLDYLNKDQEQCRKIGSSNIDSQTTIPNKFENIGNGDSIPWIFWDCPGFQDSRGPEQDIINSFYISQIVNHASQIKFVLVLDGTSFHKKGVGESKGELYKVLFETLHQMTKDSKINLSKNLVIVITKTEKPEQYYSDKLKDLFKELMTSDNFFKRIQQYYKIDDFSKFFNQLEKAPLATFPMPDSGSKNQLVDNRYRDNILGAISNTEIIANLTINLPVSIKSLNLIAELWKYSREEISRLFEAVCNSITLNFSKFNKLQLKQVNDLFKSLFIKLQKNIIRNNCEFFEEVKSYFLDKYQEVCNQFIPQENLTAQFTQINLDLNELKSLVSDVYDGLLSQVSLSEKVDQFFGKIGFYELTRGLNTLNLKFNEQNLFFEEQLKQKAIFSYNSSYNTNTYSYPYYGISINSSTNNLSSYRKSIIMKAEEVKRDEFGKKQEKKVQKALDIQKKQSKENGSNFTYNVSRAMGVGAILVGGAGICVSSMQEGAQFVAMVGGVAGALIGGGIGLIFSSLFS